MKYYSTQRPVAPGTYPKYPANMPFQIENFDKRTFIDDINREAWGWIEYPDLLPSYAMKEYELVPAHVLAAVWIESNEAYRICDPARPESAIAYEDNLNRAREYADENGYLGLEIIN